MSDDSADCAAGTTRGSTVMQMRSCSERSASLGLPIGVPLALHHRPCLKNRHALDWLNFFLAALLMGFGPFVAISLADRGWTPANVGLVLTASGVAGLLTQVPAGELIDAITSRRALVGLGIVALMSAVLMLGQRPDFPSVFAAAIVQGAAGSVLGPGIAAISLGLVGHEALAQRLGRNQRFASMGSLAAAGILGAVGYAASTRDFFIVTTALGLPVLVMLFSIRAADIHYGRSCCAPPHHSKRLRRMRRVLLFKDRRVLIFAGCLFLFQLANASILPLIGETLVHVEGRRSSLVISALIVVPQIVVALLAPWAGRAADSWGRRPLLLLGFGVVPIRALFFTLTTDPAILVVIQVLDGVSGATLGVLTTLMIADLTQETGRFNLAQGLVGTLAGIGASLSVFISGLVVAKFGVTSGFIGVTAVAVSAVAILWVFLPETKPPRVLQTKGQFL
jgi:MFS family permease